MDEIIETIKTSVRGVVAGGPFQSWIDDQRLQVGDRVLLNNSFLFREGIRSSRKSDLYLALEVADEGLESTPSVMASEKGINVSYKRVAVKSVPEYSTTDLNDAVRRELNSLGVIVYSLVGSIGETEVVSVPLSKFPSLKQLTFDPAQEDLVTLSDVGIGIKRMDGVDELWSAVLDALNDDNLPSEAAQDFDSALVALQEAAGRPVDITRVNESDPSVLGEVIERLKEQVAAYEVALETHLQSQDDESLGEMLRISYNFADGAKALLTLIVGLSDLKPILFWLTANEQSVLADRFAELPFSIVGKAKPSIDRYRSVIAAARNRAFHDVFAFGHPFHVQLSGEAFRAPELRLFREHARRREPALEFEDRELVDLLEDFTRTQERPVPEGFWDGNRRVMAAVIDVADAMRAALILCHRANP